MGLDIPLKNVAKSIRNAASAIAPRDTGNLRNVLRSYNTPERMVTIFPDGSGVIKFYTGPPGAPYGQWWNEPPALKSKNKNGGKNPRFAIRRDHSEHWNYGSKAMKDPEVRAKIKAYAKAVGKKIATDLAVSVRKK